MRLITKSLLLAGFSLASAVLPLQAFAAEAQSYKVELNKTELLRLPSPAASIIIGNPNIADVTVQSSNLLFVVGRGFGETNLIILDADGKTIIDANLQVVNTLPKQSVRIYNGSSRQTYSCLPFCGPSPVLGDSENFIEANTTEAQTIGTTTAFDATALRDSIQSLQPNDASGVAGGPGQGQQGLGPN